MKKSEGYKYVEKLLSDIKRQEKSIVDTFITVDARMQVTMYERLQMLKLQLKTAQELFYAMSTPTEIGIIVGEQIIEKDHQWSSEEKFDRNVLPKEIYCKHEEYSRDLKLQALMPNKRF